MFDIRLQEGRGLVLTGRLDASQTTKASTVLKAVESSMALDLSDLEYVSSAGIGVLVQTQKRLQSTGHSLKLVNVQPRVCAIFHYAALESYFGID
jgi:anti-sigma B factor antagonist